jgi:hypothetical protein
LSPAARSLWTTTPRIRFGAPNGRRSPLRVRKGCC